MSLSCKDKGASVDRANHKAYHHINQRVVEDGSIVTLVRFESAMSTEQKPATPQQPATPPPATEPKHEPTALAAGLTNAWDNFKQGKLLSYPLMALLLIAVALIGGGWWFLHTQHSADSARWREWDGLSTIPEYQKFAEDKQNANTIQAKLSNLEIARTRLGSEGIDRMFVKAEDFMRADPSKPLEAAQKAREARETAVKNVEKAREDFAKLAEDFKNDPVIHVECLLATAKAEAVLVGIPKEGQLAERRGNPAKAVELLDKVTAAAPDTDWGKDAKKLADALRNQNTSDQVVTLQASLFDISSGPSFPTLPGLPNMPKDAIHGFPGP
jgi:hypothetical protein